MLAADVVEQHRGDVTLSKVTHDGDDQLAGVLGTLGQFQCTPPHDGAGGNAAEDTFTSAEFTGYADRVLQSRVQDFVVNVGVQDFRNKVGADSLDLVRTGRSTVEDRGVLGLDSDNLHAGLALLEDLANTCDGAAGAYASNKNVYFAIGVFPDFLGGRGAVDRRVGLVGELLSQMEFSVLATISCAFSTAPRMPSEPGVRTISAPYARSMTRRSVDMVSGMVRMTL